MKNKSQIEKRLDHLEARAASGEDAPAQRGLVVLRDVEMASAAKQYTIVKLLGTSVSMDDL